MPRGVLRVERLIEVFLKDNRLYVSVEHDSADVPLRAGQCVSRHNAHPDQGWLIPVAQAQKQQVPESQNPLRVRATERAELHMVRGLYMRFAGASVRSSKKNPLGNGRVIRSL